MKLILLTAFVIVMVGTSSGQKKVGDKSDVDSASAGTFLINQHKPSAYISFERFGRAKPLFPGEDEQRIWLSFNNNSRFAVSVCYFPVPAAFGDAAVRYDWEQSTGEATESSPSRDGGGTEDRPTRLQRDTLGNNYADNGTCLMKSVAPASKLVFSIPKSHLISDGSNSSIRIRFEYDWENESTAFGSQPTHFVSFTTANLPSANR
jgi:hypothetical protein